MFDNLKNKNKKHMPLLIWCIICLHIFAANNLLALEITGGQDHTVILKDDGTLWTFGRNHNGQLGDGTQILRRTPQQVASGVVSVSAGNEHTVFIKTDGTVWSFGSNDSGQLGLPGTTTILQPTRIESLVGTTFIKVAAGEKHTLLLTNNGDVWSFGNNVSGQLGNGTFDNSSTPTKITTLSGVVDIAAGYMQSIVTSNNQKLLVFGHNNAGQLGIGSIENCNIPTSVDTVSNPTKVAIGREHTLVLNDDGTVWACGNKMWYNYWASVVDESLLNQVTELSDIISISAGSVHSVFLTAAGNAYVSGLNSEGNLGLGTRSEFYYYSGLSTNVSQAFGIHDRTIIVSSDGTLHSCGNNAYGQLGHGTEHQIPTPTEITKLTDVKDISQSSQHTVILKNNGSVWVFGRNHYAQQGNVDLWTEVHDPTQIDGITDAVAIDSNYIYTFILRGNGTVWKLGDPGSEWVIPDPDPVKILGFENIVAISAGDYHLLGIKSDGSVYGWGDNYAGQLGNLPINYTDTAIQVPGLSHITQIASKNQHSIMLDVVGDVWRTGSSSDGVFGATSGSNSNPAKINGIVNARAISTSYNHSVVLTSDGKVWTTGDNSGGQLGTGQFFASNPLRSLPVRRHAFAEVPNLSGVVEIAASFLNTTIRKSDGTIWSFGANTGQPLPLNPGAQTSPTQITNLKGVKKLLQKAPTTVLKEDGTVALWSGGAPETSNSVVTTLQPILGINKTKASPTIVCEVVGNNGTVSLGSSVTLNPIITGGSGDVIKVEYYHYKTLIGSSANSPFQYNFAPLTWGQFKIDAIVTDSNGTKSSRSNSVTINVPYDSDSGIGDGLPDWWEIKHFGNLNHEPAGDYDSDGLSNLQEYQAGTDPNTGDTDGDGMTDGEEVLAGLNPLINDAYDDEDGDRYPNIFEVKNSSDPKSALSKPIPQWSVNPTSGGTHTSIRDALSAINADYQIVNVTPGTYQGSNNTGLQISTFKTLLIGEYSAANTIIDAQKQSQILVIDNSSVVDGFTFKNGSSVDGGAIAITAGSPRIYNSVFLDNEAAQNGGAIVNNGSQLIIAHSTFFNNSATGSGYAIQQQAGSLAITNSIVWGSNTGGIGVAAGTVEVSYSNVQGGFAGAANLDVDPLLRNDGHLKKDSPMINAGDYLNAPDVDMDGELRPIASIVDIGADEWLDTDGDGMPDWWELANALDPNDPLDATGNPDGDALDNLAEYETGTNPNVSDGPAGDSDADGVLDSDEITEGTNPNWKDNPIVKLKAAAIEFN